LWHDPTFGMWYAGPARCAGSAAGAALPVPAVSTVVMSASEASSDQVARDMDFSLDETTGAEGKGTTPACAGEHRIR
jgi:hypothetical protein